MRNPLINARALAYGAAFTLLLAVPITACAQSSSESDDVMARVGDTTITRAEVEALAAGELLKLDMQRHDLLNRALEARIAERLVADEAARRDTTVEAAWASVDGDPTVTDAEIDAFYTQNGARIRQPKEQVVDQIRTYLVQEKRQSSRAELVATLRETHGVTTYLEPLRVPVDTAGSPAAKGPASATVTLVEFSDFQCPACKRAVPAIDAVKAKYGQNLRLEFRHFPLRSIHPQAQLAAEAANCARRQDEGAFWSMHDVLFEKQNALGRDDLVAHAETLGLDQPAFVACLDGREEQKAVNDDFSIGERAGVGSTPSLFVNGRPVMLLTNEDPVETLSRVIDDELRRNGV